MQRLCIVIVVFGSKDMGEKKSAMKNVCAVLFWYQDSYMTAAYVTLDNHAAIGDAAKPARQSS